ncbi:uncharacterized protein B0T15DRAFT_574665 [Chaetomium strumarium]|uniref:Uncharacterized protein n=1 Tax=Chaetomium strumarium TaxID=1170767 RepID=A0AAJ0GSE4_9PEZI|nr:hypothetical protein B0T15DRAFT_574665 [Chaetomium strumarium]
MDRRIRDLQTTQAHRENLPLCNDRDLNEQPGSAIQNGDGNRQFNNFGTGTQKNVDGNYFEAKGDQNFVTKIKHIYIESSRPKACRVIPFPRNEDVVDRTHIFGQLDALLPPASEYQSAALWGLGGFGRRKTQVALEYAYRRSRDPPCSVFWVHADNETAFTQDYKMIAKRLGLADGLDGPELLTAVRERIEADPCWLLILDNADNLAAFGVGRTQSGRDQGQGVGEKHSLYNFVPRGPAGTVLWTSRDEQISGSLVGAQRGINIARMTDKEAMTLLETVRNRKIDEDELDDAAQLLAELDWLPLAVSQTAAYIRRMNWSLTDIEGPGCRTVFLETWDISLQQIRRENEMAYDILHVLAFLDSQNIPLEIMIKAAALRKENMTDDRQGDESARSVSFGSDSEDDDDEVLHAAIRLQEFSFLHLRTSEGMSQAYEMHKLVQEAAQYALSRRDRRKDEASFSKLALRVVVDLFPERRRELWWECEEYVVHAQRAGEWAELCGEEIEASDLLSRVSNYMYDRGRWREKEPVDKRAYEFRQKRLGKRHPDTIWSMASLAVTYRAQGRYEQAEKIKVEVLALRRDVLGEKHPDTLRAMYDLAITWKSRQQGLEALSMMQECFQLQLIASWV